jgi:hypothetical protein
MAANLTGAMSRQRFEARPDFLWWSMLITGRPMDYGILRFPISAKGSPMASPGRSTNRSLRIIVPSPRWIWAAVGVMGLCMVGYIIAATGSL